MSRLAIFIDGGYVDKLCEDEFHLRIDYDKFINQIQAIVASKTPESVDLLWAFYYHCLPYQSDPPTADEAIRYSRKRSFFSALHKIPRFSVREGRLSFKGIDNKGDPIFQQKRVDLQLGLDCIIEC
jgi:hypothetical protein